MADPHAFQDMAWIQNGQTTYTVDLSQPAESVARRVSDYIGYSFQIFWDGAPEGNLYVEQSNAGVGNKAGGIIEPAQWVEIPLGLQLTQAPPNPDTGIAPASSPALLEVTSGRAGWVRLTYVPTNTGSGSGTLSSRIDGVRR